MPDSSKPDHARPLTAPRGARLGRRAALMGTLSAMALAEAMSRARAQAPAVLNLYSSRHYNTDQALYDTFTKATGIRINRIEAEPDPLMERMRAEGANSPADVFISVDAGRIERARQAGLLQPVRSAVLEQSVPPHLRDPQGHWFGFSKRARVIIYARERAKAADVPTYESLADPGLKGKLVIRSSTNVYNQSLTGAMLAAHGEEKTEAWCRGLVANFARAPRGGDSDQIKAIAAGEADYGVVNTYYFVNLMRSKNETDRAMAHKVGVVFPNQADRGTHINISGGGVAAHAKNKDAAVKFLEYLVSLEAQSYFADGNSEYPVVPTAKTGAMLAELGSFKEDQLNAQVFAANNAKALQIMDRAGWK
ncbi:MAG: Fe(3+) ABC transporter substrate-binding protein [Alphaproteobacteria bacterium]|nr:Fe(3+) ABC transporter substrate-binding protein [Alphaproteobacteria bacterium]